MVLCIGGAAAAPLAAGGVHRLTLALIMVVEGLGIALLGVSSRITGRSLRIGLVVCLPVVFLAIPALQSIPIPLSARRIVDAKGTALLADQAIVAPGAWPLSLDPPATRAHIGKAAAALAVFLVAFHLASGQRRRHLVTRAVSAAGIAAVVIGISHRIYGTQSIYGLFLSTHRTLLTGPFVNANHTAELLELCAFTCLACSFQRSTALNRFGWMVGVVLCAGATAATLSRGGILGLIAGVVMFAFLRYLAPDGADPARRRKLSLAWGGLLLALFVLAGGALGAGQLIERFRDQSVASDLRLAVWRDSLKVIAAHPLGIGRGAFDRVFPIYRTLTTYFPMRFAFVENEPLQMLIDGGWIFFGLATCAIGYVVWQLARNARRDRIESALVAGLFAVGVHNLVDFGLETLGILLPFVAVLGTVLGRLGTTATGSPEPRMLAVRWSRPVTLAACGGGLLVGLVSVAHASYDDFDQLLKGEARIEARRQILVRAQAVHPIDYYYFLTYARLLPLRSPTSGPSPRFHALNRALVLCPGCESVHIEVARNLWAVGSRAQALLEWRTAVEIQPKLLKPVLGDLFSAGAKGEELASIGASDPPRMLEIADFLGSLSRLEAAMTVLDQAEALGAPTPELALTRAKLDLQAGNKEGAAAALAKAHALGVRDVRLALLDAQLTVDQKGPEGAEQALALLNAAAVQYPFDLPLQRMRLDLVMRYQKWQLSDPALEGFKQALYQNQGRVAEAHVAAARIHARLGHWTNALGEFRIALADDANNVALWLEYGRAAETAGRYPTAREAYFEAGRLSPNNPEVAAAAKQLDARVARSNQDLLGADKKDPDAR